MRLSTAQTPAAKVEADWLVLPVWEEGFSPAAAQVDANLGGKLLRLRQGEDCTGKANELVSVLGMENLPTPRLLLLGLGKRTEANRLILNRAAVAASKYMSQKKRGRVALALPEAPNLSWSDIVLAMGAGLLQGCHGPGIRQTEPGRFEPDHYLLLAPEGAPAAEIEAATRRTEIEGRAVRLARDLVNEPPCDLYPESFAHRAEQLCRSHRIEYAVLDEKQLEEERMGCLLGVARGSARPPRLVALQHRHGQGDRTLGLVGKGVTFDSGGLSLKTNEQMLDMKCDMAGAAAVLAAMTAIAELKLPMNVLGILALVENLPSGMAIKVGDVLKARNGKTVEVLNTDAEGRLILADALSYAVDQGASQLVDLATLTGSCMIALGTEVAGLLSNDQPWADRVLAAIQKAGERAWQLPMFKDYGDLIKSQVADIKNVGGKYAGAITGAKFLEHFVGQTPWVHLDIAGPAFAAEDKPTQDAGGTGCFVRSLVELASSYQEEERKK